MSKTDATTLRSEVSVVLAANTARLTDGLQAELARSKEPEMGRPLQFEVDLLYWDITCCASEEPIITGDWLDRAVDGDWLERAEEAGIEPEGMICEELCPWFADCWHAVGGPARFSPAYLFLHDYHDQQYDLECRCWVPEDVAFGERA
jgi:hypothetical protein